MTPSILTLHPPAQARPTALALKLNQDVLEQLRKACKLHSEAKLIVKDGHFLIKIGENLVFPCSSSPESLRFDIYSPKALSLQEYNFTGTITDRLNVISDPRQIKEHLKASTSGTKRETSQTPSSFAASKVAAHTLKSSLLDTLRAYAVDHSDTKASATLKFLSLIALGPMKRATIEEKFNQKQVIARGDMDTLFSTHTQPYRANDTFIEGDVFPLIDAGATDLEPSAVYYILKDKAYKDIRPFQWQHYTDYERGLVVENASNALGRLGYLDTHPLRRIIIEKSSSQKQPVKKTTGLGGGLLMSNAKKPKSLANTPVLNSPQSVASSLAAKRSFSESPRLNSEARLRVPAKRYRIDVSPSKEGSLGFVASLSNSLSSEDEKTKMNQKNGKRCYSNESNNSTSSVNSGNSALSNPNSYTLPSSNNDDGNLDFHSDEDKKLSAIQKVAPSLPSRPSSSISNHKKKQQYYSQLAQKFRMRYKEYEQLYKQLSREATKGTINEKKKRLVKLFELHNSLAEWKRKLWDYHNENNMAEGVMNLSKHRKTNIILRDGASAVPAKPLASHPPKPNTGAFPSQKRSGVSERVPTKAKIALNY